MEESPKKWEQITDFLIDEFSHDVYEKGEKLPSENALSIRFAVPRTEIRRAYNRLKELGYIYSIHGRGSFFSGHKEKLQLSITDSSSFSEKMKTLGVNYRSENLGIEKITGNSPLYSTFKCSASDAIYKLTRLRYIDNNPIAIHISYISGKDFPDIEIDGSTISSFFHYLRHCGYNNFYNTNSDIVVSTLTPAERELLNVQGYAPCLILNSQCVNRENGHILEIARTIYKSDAFIFKL